MKHKVIYGILIIIIIVLSAFILYSKEHKIKNDSNYKKENSFNKLSMMLETGSGTGVYKLTTRSTWPSEGYVFNASLSKCENGSEIIWNETNATVTYHGNKTDKCYIYFDKYSLAIINNSTEDVTANSIQ